jgi:phosphatidylglycerol:prolipoprotein diacylglycerol transferase
MGQQRKARLCLAATQWYHTGHYQEAQVSIAFPLALTVGALAGLLWVGWILPTLRSSAAERAALLSPETHVDVWFVAFLSGLVVARFGFVLVHWSYYGSRPLEMLAFWEGGLSWIGGAIGAMVGLALYTRFARRPFWPLADSLAMPAALISLTSWLGCMVAGCAYGRRVQTGWLIKIAAEPSGVSTPRWPTQIAGAIYSLAIVVVFYFLSKRHVKSGVRACLSLTLISAGALALSFLRADPTGLLAGLRLDTLGSALLLVVASVGLWLRIRR